MSTAAERNAALEAFLKQLPAADPPALPEADDPLVVLIHSFLVADATVEKAGTAWERIRREIVDLNDLRVAMADEIVQMIGPRYPLAEARAERLRAALRAVYLREHEMSLASVSAMSKRDVRKYLDTLEGMLPYVAARTLLLGFGGHAVPVDARLRDQLAAEGLADENEDEAEVSARLTRVVKAADGLDVHHRLQAWSETQPAGRKASTTRKSPARKSTKKTAAKKASSKKKAATAKKTPAKKSSSKKSSTRKKAATTKKAAGKKSSTRKTATSGS